MHKKGKTMFFDKPPVIIGSAGVAGKKEGEGPLAEDFDAIFEDTTMGQQSFELAESAMLHDAIIRALNSASRSSDKVDFVLSGDLLDQCMGSAFALKDLEIPSIGLFGACSTMALSLSIGSMLISAGANCVVAQAKDSFAFRLNMADSDRRHHSGLLPVPAVQCLKQKAMELRLKQFR